MRRYEPEHAITLMARVLKVSASGYYAWRSRKASKRLQANEALTKEIQKIFQAEKGRAGAPRVAERLKAEGKPAGRHRRVVK